MKPLFITLEGIDGSGKTTQAKRIADWLSNHTDKETVLTSEPYERSNINVSTPNMELDSYLNDRVAHVKNVIIPALSNDKNVVCDRYYDSTWVYQCYAKGNFLGKAVYLDTLPKPDYTFFLRVPISVAVVRNELRHKGTANREPDIPLLLKAAEGYEALYSVFGKRIVCIEGNQHPDAIFLDISKVLEREKL